jgi:hypothetical protein
MLRAALVIAIVLSLDPQALAQRFDGFNVIAVPGHPYGSVTAHQSLAAAERAGAKAIAIVPFLQQRDPQHTGLVRGDDMPDAALRLAIREARVLGLEVLIKPQVAIEGSWAGSVEPATADDWRAWFERYRAALVQIARVAAEENAEALCIGTELEKTTQRPEWNDVIAAVRAEFQGLLTYAAHNVEEAEAVPFWPRLDLIGVTLYPKLGADDDHEGRRAAMRAVVVRLEALAAREGKPVLAAEIGIRSAKGAAAKPWESVKERAAESDPTLQRQVLADWLDALDRPAVTGVLIWQWLTDPTPDSAADTDFTVQGKPAERVLCERTKNCGAAGR